MQFLGALSRFMDGFSTRAKLLINQIEKNYSDVWSIIFKCRFCTLSAKKVTSFSNVRTAIF